MKTQKVKIQDLAAEYAANIRFADNYGNIQELAENIEAKGILVPLSVEKQGDKYGIISGHRRYAALQFLLNEGRIKEDYEVLVTVDSYDNDLDRSAAKLLSNDGQAITPDEWAAEIARLSGVLKKEGRKTWVNDIALSLGKRPEYVQQMADTWGKMGAGARKALQEGKVGMSLAVLISQRTASDKLASLSVEIAAAAKENLKAGAVKVSDTVIAEAVTMTTDKVVKEARNGTPISGAVIGADILANILKVKGAKQAAGLAARQVKKAAISGQVTDMKQYVSELIELSSGHVQETLRVLLANFNGGIPACDAIHSLINKFHKAA